MLSRKMAHRTAIHLFALFILCTKGEGCSLSEALNSTGGTCGEVEQWDTFGGPCSCSPLCAHYKDCCKDSGYFVAEEQLWDPATSTCSQPKNDFRQFHMKKGCRSDWDDDETRASCHTESGPPLTSHRTNVSYANPHCAICNYDFDASTDRNWPVGFVCRDNDPSNYAWNNDGYVWNNDSYEPNYDRYEAWITAGDHNTTAVKLTYRNKSQSYSVNYSFPVDVFSFFYSHNGTLGWLLDLITLTRYESHSKGDFNESKPYYQHPEEKNSTQISGSDYNYSCRMLPFKLDKKIMISCEHAISTCAPDWTDTDVEAMCLAYTDLYCHPFIFRNPHCALCNHVGLFEGCRCVKGAYAPNFDFSYLLNWEEYSLTKPPTLHVARRFDDSQLRKLGESNLMTQDPAQQNTTVISETNDADKPNYPLGYITIVGICLSVSCIVLHLAIFIATPRLMNLPALNLAALCVALLLLYSSFFAGIFLEPPCKEGGITTHYSLLATLCWMLVISFDVWRTIRRSITKLQRSSGLQWKRFSVYSAFCWVVPVLVMVPALVIEFSGLDTHFRPGYGQHNCWFSNATALLVFVVAPLCVVMAINIVLFSWSACLIYSTKFETENRSISRTDFCLFVRLAVIMGLTWVTGLIAGVVKLAGVWYIFVALNTLQGLFIFVAFSCNRKVYEELRRNKTRQYRPQQQLQQLLAPNIALSVPPGYSVDAYEE